MHAGAFKVGIWQSLDGFDLDRSRKSQLRISPSAVFLCHTLFLFLCFSLSFSDSECRCAYVPTRFNPKQSRERHKASLVTCSLTSSRLYQQARLIG